MLAATIVTAVLWVLSAEDRFEKAFSEPIRSVMDKTATPPGGDKHDYLSYAPYWFPDPSKKDGLPYIRKDGYRNEGLVRRGDAPAFTAMVRAVTTLSQSPERRHTANAALRLRTWFLDPATRMNPHLEYGPGRPRPQRGPRRRFDHHAGAARCRGCAAGARTGRRLDPAG